MSEAPKRITRRRLGATLAVSAAASAMAPAQQPAASDDLLAAAREQVNQTSASLRKFDVPIATEPSFQFRP